jgi:hypothetical protein
MVEQISQAGYDRNHDNSAAGGFLGEASDYLAASANRLRLILRLPGFGQNTRYPDEQELFATRRHVFIATSTS